ncbi:MAG TPA: nitroreductase family protein, partial [Rectinemataceae bacterium]|nr:nitroreductase family protein [Rectinemataceae bacterium]
SSFGLEHWRFIAVTNPAMRARLKHACFEQEAVASSPFVVAILVRRAAAYEPHSDFVRSRAERFPGGWPVFFEDYRGYYEYLAGGGRLDHWARAQAYIACANMMTGAAAAGIDSCAIEGFDEAASLAVLEAEPEEWTVGLFAVFGHAAEEARAKIREGLPSIAERRD